MFWLKQRAFGLLAVALFGFTGCAHKTDLSQATPTTPHEASRSATPPPPTTLFWNDELEKAWHLFTKNGHYRMAQPTDFRFSEQARREMGRHFEDYTSRPVVYWWGGTGVIVVDTTRTDQNRFGLIVFMEPDNLYSNNLYSNLYYTPSSKKSKKKTKPCPYEAVWLYKNKDLSRTGLEQASGYWFVFEYDDSGKRTGKDESKFGWKHRNLCG